jgi:uncharacterized protein
MREPSRISGAPSHGNCRNRHDRLSGRGIKLAGLGVKELPTDDNTLIGNGFRPITLGVVLAFLGWLGLGLGLAWLGLMFLETQSKAGGSPSPILYISSGAGQIWAMGLLYGIAIVAIVLSVRSRGREALPALALRGAGWRPVVFGSIASLALSIAASQIGPEAQDMQHVAHLLTQQGTLIPSLIVMAGLAPVGEELIFRGLLYGWLDGRWGWKVAYPVSTILFAAAHIEPAHILLVLPLAAAFGLLRWRTNSLLPSFVAHVVNNGFAVLSLIVLGS